MGTFVPGYDHDIFVSYAHVDDQALPEIGQGWVTTLVSGVRTLLAQKLGRDEAYSLWMDPQMAGNVPITTQITGMLQKSATMLVVLSPGYVESTWCKREADTFWAAVQEHLDSGGRVFVVERTITEIGRPQQFNDLRGYKFWVKEPTRKEPRTLGWPKPNPDRERAYYDLLSDLCYDLAKELRRLKDSANSSVEPSAPPTGPVVYLAEVTDDLDSQRDEVRRHLTQAGLLVLPEHWYPRGPSAFAEAGRRDLSESVAFVQLLSGVGGKKSDDLPQGYVGLQYECAVSMGKPILQWRSPDLDVATVLDPQHRKLLEGEPVLAVSIEEFKQAVVRKALEKPVPQPPPEYKFVFLNAEAGDRPLVDEVGAMLDRDGIMYGHPKVCGKPAEIRKDLEKNLLDCDCLIIVYGSSTIDWVNDQLRYCRKIISRREQPLHALGIFEGPPEEKDPLNLRLPKMQIIDCRRGLDSAAIKAFLQPSGAEA